MARRAVGRTGSPIVADVSELARLARNLRAAAPVAWAACRIALREAAEPIAADARGRASFSTRIPQTIKVRVTSGGNVKITAGGTQAPEATPLENKGRAGQFRHPVFGNREKWVSQTARPFLGPAVEAHKDEVAERVLAAVSEAVLRTLREGL